MSWDQIGEIMKAGIEIGNHSASHAFFLNLPQNQIQAAFRDDLLKSLDDFKKYLDFVPDLYAYPYGEFTRDMKDVLKKEAVKAAVVQQSGVFSESSDPFAIPRFPMGGSYGSLQGFQDKAAMKALRVIATRPDSPFFTANPPEIEIDIAPGVLDVGKVQFFVGGLKNEIEIINTQGNPPSVVLKADKRLLFRRTFYTITAPSIDGKSWHWYSYLWINPLISE